MAEIAYKQKSRERDFLILAQPEKEEATRIVIVRIRKIVGVVEVKVVVVRLEIERIIGRLPEICLFPS